MNIAFFDFDGTISRGDSLFKFVAFARGRWRLYLGLLSRFWILLLYSAGIISNTRAKQALMRYFFAGMEREAFLDICARFLPQLESMLKPSAIARLEWHKARGDAVVLVSASFEEYLKPLCEKLGIECIATKLAVVRGENRLGKNGSGENSAGENVDSSAESVLDSLARDGARSRYFLSGYFATPNCYGAQKAIRIKARYDLAKYDEIYAYGDSKGDREMLALATHAFYKNFK